MQVQVLRRRQTYCFGIVCTARDGHVANCPPQWPTGARRQYIIRAASESQQGSFDEESNAGHEDQVYNQASKNTLLHANQTTCTPIACINKTSPYRQRRKSCIHIPSLSLPRLGTGPRHGAVLPRAVRRHPDVSRLICCHFWRLLQAATPEKTSKQVPLQVAAVVPNIFKGRGALTSTLPIMRYILSSCPLPPANIAPT